MICCAIWMLTVSTVVALTAHAVHGVIELLDQGKLIANIFFTDFQIVRFALVSSSERITVITAGGDSD